MSFETKLDACGNRFIHQVEIMDAYLETVLGPLMKKNDKRVIQFAFESIIVRVISFLEEYLSCLVGLAACREEKLIRKYFTECGSEYDQKKIKNGCNLGELWRLAAKQISFRKEAKKLKRIFLEPLISNASVQF